MKPKLKKIALLGAESTGKTELCRLLAEHYQTAWVPEFARTYMEKLKGNYTLEDVVYCAEMQLKEEEQMATAAGKFLFCDTELINIKVWCSDVFKTVPSRIEEMIQENRYDLYLLTANDITFIHDPVRVNPHRREFLFDWYKKELEYYRFPYEIVSGEGERRLSEAVKAVEKYIFSSRFKV